ncbi:penicillin-binding protein 1C [Mailhella massiliensis]|uniref:peptidoglycan glycosyltransferase n=1 Tax=Mailhella massiliensis TaxID=1903261 RepID=A0A921AY04_9BACT|nr:penicillin-binding protein 1C [Mailhella massiliensis]HJD98141.1 penicillin-binding protein 1C [Mailhella massiliensis]
MRGHRIRRAALAALFLPVVLLWGWLALSAKPPLLEGVEFSPLVLDGGGSLMRMGLTSDEKYRLRVRLHEVSPEAVRAALLYEDRYFYRHFGVNPFSLLRSALSMLGGSRRMGGSTITMQVARLRLGLATQSVTGKLVQMARALQYEYHYGKDEILEAYFNLAPYGGNVEGIGAAARMYFHTRPGDLSREQALALAVVPQNPVRRSPLGGPDFDAARRRMHRLAMEGQDGSGREKRMSLSLAGAQASLRVYGPSGLPFAAPHLTSELLPLSRGGEPVRTFVDRGAQNILERALSGFAARGRRYGLHNAAALLIHWPSMEVRALAGSADFFHAAISGQVDGTRARRSPGSTLKPFIYALALDQGLIHPRTLLADSPRSFGGYDPENFDRVFRGPLPAEEALRASRNIPAIALAARLRPGLYSFLQRAGVELPFSEEHYGLSLVLGGAEVSMRELGGLYAMLANRGVWRQIRLFAGEERKGAVPLLSPEAAIVALRMLEDGAHAVRGASGLLPLRVKTGTSNGFRDAWTAGVVGPYVLVVWAGNFDNTQNPLLVGGEVAAPLFADIAQALAARDASMVDLIPRQQEGLNITREKVCAATGDLDISLCGEVVETWYIPGRSPTRPSGVFRTILIDKETGLRACEAVPGRTEEKVWEFWPSDLRAQFLRAGVVKPPPPPFGPGCGQERLPGMPPDILSPKEGVVYQRSLSSPERSVIALTAGADADAGALFWFVKDRFLGRSLPGEPLFWNPDDGVHELRVVDDRGRAASRTLVVKTLP